MFSNVVIEFLIDFQIGYGLSLRSSTNGTPNTPQSWDWVATRSAAFEVTTGTPTGIDGETTAINFKSAFDLDNPTGYTTSVVDNTITITSTTTGEVFDTVKASSGLDPIPESLNVTFNNIEEPVDNTNIDLALVRSPHYINIPFEFNTTTSVTAKLYIWDGDLTVVPSTPTETITLPRPSIDFAEFNTSISEFVEEKIDGKPNINITTLPSIVNSDANSLKWIRYEVNYTDSEEIIADITGTLSGVEGYGLYSEGVNPTKPSNDWLTTCFNRRVPRNGIIILPFLNTGQITSIIVTSTTNQINSSITVTSSNESTEFLQYVQIDVSQATSDQYITVSDGTNNVIYEIYDECRYTPKQVIFKNRFGAYDIMTLFKKSANTLSVTKSMFVNQYLTNGIYDQEAHQMKDINIQAMESIRLNSGFINEAENELYKQMLTSDEIYFYEGDNLIPIRAKKSSLEFKTRINDGLINYEMDFDYAYNYIQNV